MQMAGCKMGPVGRSGTAGPQSIDEDAKTAGSGEREISGHFHNGELQG